MRSRTFKNIFGITDPNQYFDAVTYALPGSADEAYLDDQIAGGFLLKMDVFDMAFWYYRVRKIKLSATLGINFASIQNFEIITEISPVDTALGERSMSLTAGDGHRTGFQAYLGPFTGAIPVNGLSLFFLGYQTFKRVADPIEEGWYGEIDLRGGISIAGIPYGGGSGPIPHNHPTWVPYEGLVVRMNGVYPDAETGTIHRHGWRWVVDGRQYDDIPMGTGNSDTHLLTGEINIEPYEFWQYAENNDDDKPIRPIYDRKTGQRL